MPRSDDLVPRRGAGRGRLVRARSRPRARRGSCLVSRRQSNSAVMAVVEKDMKQKDKRRKRGNGEWTGKAEVVSRKAYNQELRRLQDELVRLEEWVKYRGLRVVALFEGRDTAGKGGVIKRITALLNPRFARVVALPAPTERERSQWYFQRYIAHLPSAGEIVFFDRSWYNRAGVERVMGLFSDEEQEKRFLGRINDPSKRWKLSPMDLQARARWVDYSEAKDQMFAYTDIPEAPWYVVETDNKRSAHLNLINHFLSLIPYEQVPHDDIKLPPRQKRSYIRPPKTSQRMVPIN